MEKNKIVATIAILVILISSVALLTPNVSAAPQHQIILPFYTGWENVDPLGRINSVDSKKDFYGYYGPDDPLAPELGWRDNEVSPPSDVFGYEFGSRQLMAAGYFESSYSYCYFNLFDMTADSDWAPPFKIKPHTLINIWYYHMNLGDCMIDAQLYNKGTHQYWTLRDFNYGGEYIVDQNGVRIHPAYRCNDPVGSWQFACFDLSIIYKSDHENWYVTKIWIGFDNGNDHVTGQARTYFDNLHLSYGVGGKEIHTDWDWADGDNAWTSGSLVAWDYHHRADGYYDLWLKVLISGFDDGYWVHPIQNYQEDLYPYKLKVSAGIDAQALIDPKPTGVNLTKPDPDWLKPKVYQFVYDSAVTIISFVPYGWTVSALDLALKFYGLLKPPEAQPTYQWPKVDWGTANADPKNRAEGEVYILIPGLSNGSHTIPITFSVEYYYKRYLGGYEYTPVYVNTVSLTLNLPWSTIPDDVDVNLPPETPSTPSGETSGYVGTTYSYSTSTTDPDGDPFRYEFDWGDGSTTTTCWYISGFTATASHSWSSPGTYNVKVRAQDWYWEYSDWSPYLTVNIVNKPPEGWVSPTGHEDPDDDWTGEANAYDDVTSSWAKSKQYSFAWTKYLILTLDSPIQCSKIRFYPHNHYANIDKIDVDVYKNDAWVDVYEGHYQCKTWEEKTFSEGSVTKARVRFWTQGIKIWSSWLPAEMLIYEFDFWGS